MPTNLYCKASECFRMQIAAFSFFLSSFFISSNKSKVKHHKTDHIHLSFFPNQLQCHCAWVFLVFVVRASGCVEKDFFLPFFLFFCQWALYMSPSYSSVTKQNGLQSCKPTQRLDLSLNYSVNPTCHHQRPYLVHTVIWFYLGESLHAWHCILVLFLNLVLTTEATKSLLTRLTHCFITGFWTSEFALCLPSLWKQTLLACVCIKGHSLCCLNILMHQANINKNDILLSQEILTHATLCQANRSMLQGYNCQDIYVFVFFYHMLIVAPH